MNLSAQFFSYSDEPLVNVITEVESQTSYHFLYREAMISDIRITFEAESESVIEKLSLSLNGTGIGMKVDKERRQALLFTDKTVQKSTNLSISGYVLDDKTGERLPFSTLSWRTSGTIQGIAANENGSFKTVVTEPSGELTIIASYVGYKPTKIVLNSNEKETWTDLAIRLEPELFGGKEIIISGVNFYTASDTVMKGLLEFGRLNPLGENNSVRSLQTLPSVTMTTAISDGINIRGSSPDGFRVLLDGQTIYHENHLFGLMDAMNPDVLRTSGFYYNITPAQFQAPLGGTLALITRTGSVNNVKASAQLSNTAASVTAEGPIIKGKASWLLSGRHSYIDQINWMNNQSLIEYGLDVDRPASIELDRRLPVFVRKLSLNAPTILDTDAGFYDLHAKLHFESKNGGQFHVSGYTGYDDAFQRYERRLADSDFEFESNNLWRNHTISGGFTGFLNSRTLSSSSIGYSIYDTEYAKDDFEYQILPDQRNRVRADTSITSPISLDNSLYEFSLRQAFTSYFKNLTLEYGIDYSDFDVRYTELSLIRPSFISRRTSQLVDVYLQSDYTGIENIILSVGNRMHYFSNGRYLRWSPRLKLSHNLSSKFSWNAGFSRNYQFTHRLEFYNNNSTDFWILTNKDQPPSSVKYYTAGFMVLPVPTLVFQIEGYYKSFENLRLHELNAGLVSTSFTNLENPWFTDTNGKAKGVEFMIKQQFSQTNLTASYTLSSVELKNPRINGGEYFYANWDRRHQISFAADFTLMPGLNLNAGWMYGSGVPNTFDLLRFIEAPRLPDYSRVDVGIQFNRNTSFGTVKSTFSIYNLLNSDNPWYSERKPATWENLRGNRNNINVLTHVYDLGIQPSFSLGFYF